MQKVSQARPYHPAGARYMAVYILFSSSKQVSKILEI